jgi:hypothetical protein
MPSPTPQTSGSVPTATEQGRKTMRPIQILSWTVDCGLWTPLSGIF